MSKPDVPEAAVRAAFIEIYEKPHIEGVGSADIRRALMAAAPFIQAVALREAADAWREYLPVVAGYGKVQPVPVWLERRAEWITQSLR